MNRVDKRPGWATLVVPALTMILAAPFALLEFFEFKTPFGPSP
jgi:hypothetical protein